MAQRADITELGKVGYIADLNPVELPPNAWSFMQNIRCVDGSIASFSGYEVLSSISIQPDVISKVKSVASTFLVYAEGDSIYSYTAGVETDISSRTYVSSGKWDACILGGVVILTNGVENPQYWGGDGLCVDLPVNPDGCTWADVGFNALMIRNFKNYLFALDVNDCSGRNRRRLRWSHPAEPGTVPITWDITDATRDAGDKELSDTPGAIIDGLTLRDTLQIYKEDAIYSVTFTGDRFIFNFRLVSSEHGLYSRNCVCDIGGRHVFVGDGDIYLYDGMNFTSIADKRVRDLFFDNVSRTYFQRSFVTFNQRTGEVWVCYPTSGNAECNKALVWNSQDNTWSPRDIPDVRCAVYSVIDRNSGYSWSTLPYATWSDWGVDPSVPSWTSWGELVESSPVSDSLVLASDGELYEMDRTNQDDGVSITCIARRTHLDAGGLADWHMVTRVLPRATGDPFQVRVGMHSEVNDTVTWSDYQTFTPGTDYKLDFRVTGRLHAIEFSSTADVSWEVHSYEVEFNMAGRR